MQNKLLAAMCQSREAFDLMSPHLGERELGPQGMLITKHIGEYYDRDPEAASVDTELLLTSVSRGLANDKHKQMFEVIIKRIEGAEVSLNNVVNDVLDTKLHAVGMDLSAALAQDDTTRIHKLMDEYAELKEATGIAEDTASFNNVRVEDLFDKHLNEDNKIKLLPKVLNDQLNGGMLRGQHLVLFARPEMGKSATCLTMIWGFLLQGLRVLYVTNEDLPATLAARAMSAVTGWTETQLRAKPNEAQEKLEKCNWGDLYIEELVPGTVRELRTLVGRIKPDVLIVDQLRNISTSDDGKAVQLEEAAKGVRNIGKHQKCLVISVTQAGGEAEGVLTLNSNMIDNSKTGIPGACDVLVGMGANEAFKLASQRRLSLCKNKTGGGHSYVDVEIVDSLSRLK